MKVDEKKAERILREAAAWVDAGQPIDSSWREQIERFSQLCEQGKAHTHVAFLATSILAKATAPNADLIACKPDHALDNPRAYSARTLSETVIVPWSARLQFSIGVTGKQPLNNMPYFRMTYLGDGTPVRAKSKVAFDYMVELIRSLQDADEATAFAALRAFIAVRRTYQQTYDVSADDGTVTPANLLAAIRKFSLASEGGRRAQATVAGLFDVVYPGRIDSGRINDPSRRSPGDVCVRSVAEGGAWEKAVEVRDKPVSLSDVAVFGRACVAKGARDAAIVMVSRQQLLIDPAEVEKWAGQNGVTFTLFYGWEELVGQALFWAGPDKPKAAELAAACIRERLIGIEVAPSSVTEWDALIAAAGDDE